MPDAQQPPQAAWPDLSGRLTPSGHILPVRVYYEDTDFSGLVYHASYLRFMERGRSDYLRHLGFTHASLSRDGLAFAVRRMAIDFLRPARIDDALDILTEPAQTRGASLDLAQSVRRGDVLLTAARVTIAVIDSTGRPRRLPPLLRAAFSPNSDG